MNSNRIYGKWVSEYFRKCGLDGGIDEKLKSYIWKWHFPNFTPNWNWRSPVLAENGCKNKNFPEMGLEPLSSGLFCIFEVP